MPAQVSAEWVRGAVVAAQRIPPPAGPAEYEDAASVLRGMGLIQLDPLTRVSTAQRLTCLTRLPRQARAEDVDASLWPADHPVSFEAFTKVACVFPLEDWPLLRLRREAVRERHGHKVEPHVRERILELVSAHPGGAATGTIEAEFGPERTTGWHWSQVKKATELMVRMGDLVVTARRGVVRLFDLPERALPAAVHEAEHLPPDELRAGLARRAAGALGVMSVADFAHHYHLSKGDAAHGVELADLVPMEVEGWRETVYVLPSALEHEIDEAGLGPVREARLIGPFDPLLRDRRRAQRIFGFDYTFEAYVPKAKRVYGHYVMGVLSGNQLIGRADLWRSRGELVVNQMWPEPGFPRRSAEARTTAAAKTLARQLGTDLRLP
ncbi:DNA glycosylase AlkZ-like family protein [Nesterenkonia populi]|uniref:DNA glycosylase AlkZ-like family protein n=1 Tax=Nesterenkonia populi TaxID=1591087 RepID=UPI0011BE9696|nr:crosslink repair DNA glycosylase YcaQ family protein [Nesterenkonia populi]